MNRALPLLLLIAAIAGGLGYMALGPAGPTGPAKDSPDGPSRQATGDDTAEAPPEGVEIAPVAPLGTTARGETALMWDIIPMTQVGQIIRDARITATRDGRERTGAGRIKWTDATAGTWDLVVEAEGKPTWRRTVTLSAGERTRTVARLGDSLRIDGTIIDSFGEPVAGTTVYFLPRGTLHPSRTNVKPTSSLPAARTPEEAMYLSATTSAAGQFRVDVPNAGAWRISVGAPGAARWTQSKTSDLTHGGPGKFIATIPALARVLFECAGPASDRPTLIRAYRFDAEVTQKTDLTELDNPVKKPGPQKDKGGQTDETSTTELTDGSAYTSTGRPAGQLFDPGWVLYRSARVESDGTALLRDIPSTEDFRFFFMRQSERMVTAGAYRFQANKRSIAAVYLPAPGSVTVGTVDERASLNVRIEDIEAQEPGVTWSY